MVKPIRPTSLLILGVLLAVGLFAIQTVQQVGAGNVCDGNNYLGDDILSGSTMGGPTVGIQWIPSSDLTVSKLEVFTGGSKLPNALGIWSDDGSGGSGKPLSSLAHTDVFIVNGATDWQGANLLSSVSVTAGTKYWIVWDPTGGEPASIDIAGTEQWYWGSTSATVSGGGGWFGPFSGEPWKFRISCGGGAKSQVLIDSGVPGVGIVDAPGLDNEFNPNSRAGDNAGKKR